VRTARLLSAFGDRLLAEADPIELLSSVRRGGGFSKSGLGILLGAIVAVVTAVLFWAIFIRKPEDERPRSYSYPDGARVQSSTGTSDSGRNYRRKRRRRRAHRPRNPTLAETGGLPPSRHDLPAGDPP